MKAYSEPAKKDGYYCHDCDEYNWGYLRAWTRVDIEFDGDLDDLRETIASGDLTEYGSVYDMVAGDCGCNNEHAGDDNCFTTFSEGDELWFCGECDTMYMDEDEAVDCCQ